MRPTDRLICPITGKRCDRQRRIGACIGENETCALDPRPVSERTPSPTWCDDPVDTLGKLAKLAGRAR